MAEPADAEINVKLKTDIGEIETPHEVVKIWLQKAENQFRYLSIRLTKNLINKQEEAVGDVPVFNLQKQVVKTFMSRESLSNSCVL